MSVKVLSDNGYTTIFEPNNNGVTVHDVQNVQLTLHKPPVLQGWHNAQGLWMVPLVVTSNNITALDLASNVYELPSTQEVVRFLHAALGFPTKSAPLTTVWKGNLVTFPGLTIDTVTKFFPESNETKKGTAKQGVRSVVDEDAALEFTPQPGIKHKDAYLRMFNETKRTMYSDQMGRLPITSSRGNKYLMVAVELDGNYEDAEPLKACNTKELINAYQTIMACWKATGIICPN